MDFEAARANAKTEDEQLQLVATQSLKKLKVPHLTNLNEDPQLSEVVTLAIEKGDTSLGRKDAGPTPKIVLTGLGIQKKHAVITLKGKEVIIKPGSRGAKIKVNG